MSSSALLDTSAFDANDQLALLIRDLHRRLNDTDADAGQSPDADDGQLSVAMQEFIDRLFYLLLSLKIKHNAFRKIYEELVESGTIENAFLVLVKLGQECFKQSLLDLCETLMSAALAHFVDAATSERMKMTAQSTLSACYWRQSKYDESIDSMNRELKHASLTNHSSAVNAKTRTYIMTQKYRIYGNLANAYKFLQDMEKCLLYTCQQYDISITLKNPQLTVNCLISIGTVYMQKKDYTNALNFFDKSYRIIDSMKVDQTNEKNFFNIENLKLKQLNLIGECYIKLEQFDEALCYFLKQLEVTKNLLEAKCKSTETYTHIWFMYCTALLNIGLLYTKLEKYKESISWYSKALNNLKKHDEFNLNCLLFKYQVLAFFNKAYIEIINVNTLMKDFSRASFYAYSMLDFALKELEELQQNTKLNESDHLDLVTRIRQHLCRRHDVSMERVYLKKCCEYLRVIELSSISKIAQSYSKQNRVDDALILHQKEASLAAELKDVFYLTRAYSHMAQIYFEAEDYPKSIELYRKILDTIEKEMDADSAETSSSSLANSSLNDSLVKKNNRFGQIIYFTLSNIGLCMKKMKRNDEACGIFYEQYEASKHLKDSKYKANALLNIANLLMERQGLVDSSDVKLKLNPDNILLSLVNSKLLMTNSLVELSSYQDQNEQTKKGILGSFLNKRKVEKPRLLDVLNELMDVYTELGDLNGQLFVSQHLAYFYNSLGVLKLAVKYYSNSVELCQKLGQDELLAKSLYNLSLCYRMLSDYENAYKCQMEYFSLTSSTKVNNEFFRLTSLGSISELLCEIDDSVENCENCIQIHLKRLKLIHDSDSSSESDLLSKELSLSNELASVNSGSLKETGLGPGQSLDGINRSALIANSLDIIAKCHYKLKNYEQAYKFKLLEIQFNEGIQVQTTNGVIVANVDKKTAKIWFDLGNMLFYKLENPFEAYKHFEKAFRLSLKLGDQLLQSLILGNMGLIKQKFNEHKRASELFKKQISVLEKRLKKVEETKILKKLNTFMNSMKSSQIESNPFYEGIYVYENSKQLSEVVSMNIDIGRSYYKMVQSQEELNKSKNNANSAASTSSSSKNEMKYYYKYLQRFQYLYENHAPVILNLCEFVKLRTQLSEDKSQIVNASFLEELYEQIVAEYDLSLSKLAFYHFKLYHGLRERSPQSGTDRSDLIKAIELTEKRLKVMSDVQAVATAPLGRNLYGNQEIEINFLLATLYSKETSTFNKSIQYCKMLIDLFRIRQQDGCDDNGTYLIETLNLLCDITIAHLESNAEYDLILINSLKSYEQIWNESDKSDPRILQLKYDTLCRVCSVYERLGQPDESLKYYIFGIEYFLFDFQNMHLDSDEAPSAADPNYDNVIKIRNFFSIHYLEYLFFLHRKVSLIYLRHYSTNAADESVSKDGCLASLKHANSALNFLNYQKEFINIRIFKQRQASIYWLLGKCHYLLRNDEMSMEMFANSLDLYESLVSPDDYDVQTTIRDQPVLAELDIIYKNQHFDGLKHSDEEASVNYLQRIDMLYQHIENALININKHQEALLVVERHRAKTGLKDFASCFPDLLNMDQIKELIAQQDLHFLIYYHHIEVNSTLNCWMIAPDAESPVKFFQIPFQSLSDLILKYSSLIKSSPRTSAKISELAFELYGLLLKPFEAYLKPDSKTKRRKSSKPPICLIYDQSMIDISFHLFQFDNDVDNRTFEERCLFSRFEINVLFSVKYLFKLNTYEQKYFSKNQTIFNSILTTDLENLTGVLSKNKNWSSTSNHSQYELLILFVRSDQRDVEVLNHLVNQILSSLLTKSILIEFYRDNDEKAQLVDRAKKFSEKIYSKMKFKPSLQPSLILSTILESAANTVSLNNYILIGNLLTKERVRTDSFTYSYASSLEPSMSFMKISTATPGGTGPAEQKPSAEKLPKKFVLTFNRVLVEFIRLSITLQKSFIVANIAISILDDFLNCNLAAQAIEGRLNKKALYRKFVNIPLEAYQLEASKILLEPLGFVFDEADSVALPDSATTPKLRHIHKVLLALQNFDQSFIAELHEIFKSKSAQTVLSLINKSMANINNSIVVLNMRAEAYKRHEKFFESFANCRTIADSAQIKLDTNVFESVILILTILFTDDATNTEMEASLEDYIRVYFDQMEQKNLALWPFMRLQNYESIGGEEVQKKDIKLTKRPSSVLVSSRANSSLYDLPTSKSRVSRMIEANVDTFSEGQPVYDHYLSELLYNDINDLNKCMNKQAAASNSESANSFANSGHRASGYDSSTGRKRYNYSLIENPKANENEFKCKYLIKLEEREYFDIITTTTTTIKTTAKDDLYMLFETDFIDNKVYYDHQQNSTSSSTTSTTTKRETKETNNIFINDFINLTAEESGSSSCQDGGMKTED